VTLVAFTWGDLADLALAIFLILVGLGLAWAFLTLGGTLLRLSTFIRKTERELLPVITKVGGTVDRVNDQLDKVDQMTDSAVDAVAAVDGAVRTVSTAVSKPVQKLSGLVAGVTHGASSLKTRRDWRGAVRIGKDAAARRERDLADDVEKAGQP
jgi:uncharacterized protein YoxC